MDPISIGVLLASLAAAGGGSVLNSRNGVQNQVDQWRAETQQAQQAADEARARNAVLDTYLDRQHGYIGENQGTFNKEVGGYTPAAQAAASAGAQKTRGDAIAANIDQNPAVMPQFQGTESPVVADAFKKAFDEKLGQSRESGKALGNLGAVGDVWAGNSRNNAEAERNIGTTNTISRNDIATLPAAQDLAGFQTRRVATKGAPADNSVGNLLIALGNAGGAVAGSGAAGKFASGFSPFGAVSPGSPLYGGKWSIG